MEKQLPKNWVETDLENLFNLVYGKGLSVSDLLEDGYDVYGANGIIGKYDKFTYEKSKVIISCRGAASGAMRKTNPKSYVTSNSIVLDEVSDKLLNLDFVKYSMIIADKSDVITGTAQPQITIQLLKYLKFRLPPLPEQHRIVAKLDMLFTQLETIKTSMANIPLLLKDFRQQVLTQAVTGKLTEEWRKGKKLGEWKKMLLNDICDSITDGDHQAPPQINEGIPFLVISNVSKGYFEFEKVTRFVSQEYYNSLKDTRKAKKGDILYTVTGSYGIPILVDFNKEFCFQRHIAILRPENNKVYSNFLKILLQSNLIFTQARNVATGTAQLTVPLGGIKKFEVNLPTTKEQQEIVSRVESLFTKADAIEQQYKALKVSIDTLPQALLHKAFKGELSEQIDSDGDARELLEEIKALKDRTGKVIKSKVNKIANKKVKPYSETEEVLGMVAEEHYKK